MTSSRRRRSRKIKVGTIIVATGFQTFDAKRVPQYGYGIYPERLYRAGGRAAGQRLRPDGRRGRSCATAGTPKAIGIIHCVGSRDKKTNRWCSRVCCMYSLKLAHLLKEHTEAEIFNFYIDMRTPGKGYEEFYDKLLEEGVHFIRGRVAEVTDWALTPRKKASWSSGSRIRWPASCGASRWTWWCWPPAWSRRRTRRQVRRMFNMSCGTEGFFLERHPKLAPVNTFTDGIFLAGCCQGPQGHPGHRRPGRRRRRRGDGADRRGLHRDRSRTPPTCWKRTAPAASPAFRSAPTRHHVRGAKAKGRDQRGALQRLRHLRRLLSFRLDPPEPVRRRADLQRNRRSPDLCLKPWSRRIVAFFCNWCTYLAADLAGISRIKYAPNTRVIRVMCSGRVDPQFVLEAFAKGADGVLIGGCHPGDCHYQEGNYKVLRRFRAAATACSSRWALKKSVCGWSGSRPRKANALSAVINDMVETATGLRSAAESRGKTRGSRGGRMKPKVAFYWCASCGGCEETVLDLEEQILSLVDRVDIVFWPVALDFQEKDIEDMPDGSIAICFHQWRGPHQRSAENGAASARQVPDRSRLRRVRSIGWHPRTGQPDKCRRRPAEVYSGWVRRR